MSVRLFKLTDKTEMLYIVGEYIQVASTAIERRSNRRYIG